MNQFTNTAEYYEAERTNTAEYYEAEDALFKLLHVNPDRVGHLSTDAIYEAAQRYVAAVDTISAEKAR